MATDLVREPTFLKICAILSVLGFIGMFVSNIIGGIIVPDYDMVADTISDLGAGKYSRIQDAGFYAYAMSLFTISLGLAHVHSGGWRWSVGILALVLTGALVLIMGGRNEYGDGDEEGIVLHIYFVYGFALMLLAAPLLLSSGLEKWGKLYRNLNWCFAAIWPIAAPIFFFLPTAYDGLWERGLGILVTGWLLILTLGLWKQAQEK